MTRQARTTAAPVWSWPVAGRAALTDLGPAVVSLAPIGLVVGLAIGQVGIGALLGVGSGLGIYAGSAQLSALDLLGAGAAAGAVVASVALINARLVLYAATLEPHFRDQPGWFRWLAPHFIVEFTFALATARDDLSAPAAFRRYWLALGGLMALAWAGLLTVGATAGPALAGAAGVLAVAPAAFFVALLVPRLTGRPPVAGAAAAFAVTGVLALTAALPPGVPVLAGAGAGVATAAWLRGRST